MKATELRIGNWVEQADGKYYAIYSRQLFDFDEYQNYGDRAEVFSKWKPIPLTEEWLVKFGFDKVKNLHENTYPDFKKRSVELLTNVNGFYVLNRSEGFTDIHYVHQLQNLYFALTGEELTA